MDDNIDVKPSDPYMSTGHEMNQSDLLTYDMSNQQVPGYQDDDDYDGDEIDDGLSHIHNQSSFIPSQTGKEQYTDSSLSDSNVGLGREDGLLFDQSRDQCDFIDQGQTNPFQPDLLNMNPLSLESKNGHIRDDLFEPNVLSKMSSNQMEHNVDDPDLQTPDLLMMESSPMHAEISEKQEPKHSTDTEFKSCDEPEVQTQNELQNKQEAIENDFYNADDSMENYDDEYVDSEESEYSDYIDDEKEAGLEQIVPELGEEQHTEIKPENVLTDNVDPNIGASGFSQKEEKFSKIVQFDENVGHLQVSDEENGNIDDKNNQDFFSKIEPGTEVLVGSVASENATEIRTKYASEMASGTEGKPNDGSVEKTMDDTQLEAEPTEPEGIPKSNTFTIESDSSDLEERSLSPDPDQLNNMETGSQFQNFAAGHSKDQDQIEDLIAGPLMEEDEESDDLDEDEVLDFDKNETVSQQTYPFEGNQIPSSFTEQTSENLGSIEMEQKDVHSEIFNDNVAMASDQNQVLDDQDASQVELADDIQTETGSQAFNENVSDNMDKGEINFVQQPSSGFSNMISDKNENDNKILEEIYDDFDEFTKTGQIQSREDILIDTSDDKTDTGEMDNLQQHTSQMSSAPEIGGLIDIGHSDNQTNEEDTKTDMDTGVRLSLEPNISDISKTDSVQIDQPEMLGQGQMNSDSEEESYNKEMKAKESGMEGSIVLDEGETFDDQKFEQDIDESMSSEEDNETPVKGFVSNNLPQLSADEINQEKITPQSLDDTPIMTGLDTTSNDIQKDEESFDDQKFEQDIDEPMSSEEDNETPLKGFVSKNLPQLSADEINQEKITPQSLDDTPIMTGLDTTSNDIQKEEESFDDQKFEQDIDEPMSSEEDNETPVKGFVSKNLPQLSADEINQEKITPQSLDDTPIMTGLDTTSNDIQKEEESFDDQNGEPEIDQSRPSVDVTAEGQMEEPGTKSLLDQDEGEAMEDKHTDDKDQENVELSPEVIPEEIPSSQKRESGMEGSFVLDQGESFDDKHFNNDGEEYVQSSPDDSPEDEIPANKRESGMEGSFVLDEGETFDDKNFDNDNEEYVQSTPEVSPEDEIPPKQSRESGMEGSFVLDQGETFEDKQFNDNQEEFVQSTPEESPEDEIPANQMRESGMEGSFVLDEGETFDDKTFDDNKEEFVQSTPEVSPEDEIPANQMRESGMEGSFVLDEGETFDNNNFDDNGEEFVQSTPEVTPEVSPQDEVPPNQTRESGMEGSFVLDEGESFDDKKFGNNEEEFEQSTPEVSPENEVPPNQTRESGMEGSFVLDKGESFDDKKFGNNEEEFEQSTPEVSPEDEVPPNQTRESGMEGSFVLDEGESFDDKKFGNNEEEFEQSTPEVSPEDEVPASQMRESGIEGSFVLEEGETFDDKKFSGNDEEFVQSTPEISPEDKIPVNQVKESKIEEQVLDEMYEKDVAYLEESISSEGEIKETASGGPFVPEEEQIVDEGIGPDKPTIEQEIQLNGNNQTSEVAKDSELLASEEKFGEEKQEAVDEGQLETPGDSYGEEGDVDSAIQSPLSQDEMIQSPSSDVNAAMYVEHENEKNLMSSSLVEESFGLNQVETIETYQPCLQNGVSHSESEEVTPEKEAPEPICYQNGISQSASEEFTPEKEAKMMSFNLVQDDQEKESISKLPDQKLEVKDNEKVEVKKESKKIVSDIKKEVKETSKKAAISTKPERKKDITKETKKMSKDISQKKEVHSRLPSPTKRKAEKRSVSTSRITTPPSKTTTPATRMPRDTTRKSRPPPTSTEPTKTIPTKQRPKSIDISRTSSLTRPTASSLNKSRMFEKSTMEGTPSPTKPSRSITKTAPSRYRITKSKKDGSSDSGVEEDKSPRKTETQKKSEDEKVTRATSAPKKSTIPTMNRTPVKSEASPTKSAGKTTPTNRTAQSKIGSLGNSKYTPGGGQVKIQSQRAGDFSNVSSKIGSKDHMSYKPKGGDKKIQSQKLEWKAESKVGSLHNANHSPGGGTVKIATERLTWNAHSKVRSLENASHSPGGGHVKILDEKTYWTSKARVDALNTGYTPRHGDVQIQSENLKWKAGSRIDANNTGYSPGGGNVHIHDERTSWRASPKVKSLENADYKPGGGNVQIHDEKHMWTARSQINSLDNINYSPKSPRVFTIENKKLDFKDIRSKVGSKDKITYKPGGGDKKIETQKLSFKEKAQSKVGSKDNMDHKPAGGDKKLRVGIRAGHPGT